MAEAHGYLRSLLKNLAAARNKAGLTEAQLEEQLILGPGWVSRFENGETVPTIDMVLAILKETNGTLADLLVDLPKPDAGSVERCIFAKQDGKNIIVYFRYANFDAAYTLNTSTLKDFEEVIKTLRDGLAKLASLGGAKEEGEQSKAIKTDAVARCFLKAVQLWPHANPSDLWWFIVYRAYCDPYNHPAQFARLDFSQSWKRTGGWALEEILARHYGPLLKKLGINLFIASGANKQKLAETLKLPSRIEADKIDVILTGDTPGGEKIFGVVHVKASFAERRTDDVPLSESLIKAGYTSPLWTMDCKSSPGIHPINRGELGPVQGQVSAKRKDIESEGYFTGCFSYNKNTIPSPPKLPMEKRITVCDFSNPDDQFSRFVISRWQKFRKS